MTVVILSTAATVFANATPIYTESFPAFNIAPVVDTPIDSLPEQDLVFSTYPQAEVTHSLKNRLFPHGYGMLLVVIVIVIILAALLVTVVYLCVRKPAH